jgi:hypothetical protein
MQETQCCQTQYNQKNLFQPSFFKGFTVFKYCFPLYLALKLWAQSYLQKQDCGLQPSKSSIFHLVYTLSPIYFHCLSSGKELASSSSDSESADPTIRSKDSTSVCSDNVSIRILFASSLHHKQHIQCESKAHPRQIHYCYCNSQMTA